MKPIYSFESGIKPWEQTTEINDTRFITITIIHRSVNEIVDLWYILVENIAQLLPRTVKWRTIGHSIEGSRVQELKLVKLLKSDLGSEDILEKNNSTNIYSYVKRIKSPLHDFDLHTMTQPKYTVLLFLPETEPNCGSIWKSFKNCDAGLDAKGIEYILHQYCDSLMCRVFESDTYTSCQFIGVVDQINILREKLDYLGVARINKDEIPRLIRN